MLTYAWFLIGPQNSRALAREFYAPNMTFAFGLARARWPMEQGWTCHSVRR